MSAHAITLDKHAIFCESCLNERSTCGTLAGSTAAISLLSTLFYVIIYVDFYHFLLPLEVDFAWSAVNDNVYDKELVCFPWAMCHGGRPFWSAMVVSHGEWSRKPGRWTWISKARWRPTTEGWVVLRAWTKILVATSSPSIPKTGGGHPLPSSQTVLCRMPGCSTGSPQQTPVSPPSCWGSSNRLPRCKSRRPLPDTTSAKCLLVNLLPWGHGYHRIWSWMGRTTIWRTVLLGAGMHSVARRQNSWVWGAKLHSTLSGQQPPMPFEQSDSMRFWCSIMFYLYVVLLLFVPSIC